MNSAEKFSDDRCTISQHEEGNQSRSCTLNFIGEHCPAMNIGSVAHPIRNSGQSLRNDLLAKNFNEWIGSGIFSFAAQVFSCRIGLLGF
jgi:hypothetical protein